MSKDYIRHPSGMIYPVETHEDEPKKWPGMLSDPAERGAMNHHLQLMYRSLDLHNGGRHDLRDGFKKYARWLLGEWYFEAEERG